MLNVAAYIPKDLSTADLQKKKPLKATNVFVIQEFSHETQPLQEFCSKISLENLHKSSLSVCSKYANPRNSQCRQTLGKSTHTPHHVLVWLFLCAFWVMSLWFHIPHHTFPVNNTNNISLLTTKVPLRAPPGWQLDIKTVSPTQDRVLATHSFSNTQSNKKTQGWKLKLNKVKFRSI